MAARNQRAVRKSGGPDGSDIKAVLKAIKEEYGASAEVCVYADLFGDLFVEAMCDYQCDDGGWAHISEGRAVRENGEALDSAILISLHRLYHAIGRGEGAPIRLGKPV
jgi:hypothetical protein